MWNKLAASLILLSFISPKIFVLAEGVSYGGLQPKKTDDFYSGEDELALEEVTDQGIEELEKLESSLSSRSDNRREIWLRLGQLYMEKAKLLELRAFREFDKIIAKDKTYRGKVELSEARSFNKKAIKMYKRFLKYYSKDERIDQVYFILGQNYFSIDQSEKGLAYFYQLTKKFPKSNFVVESTFALGEFYFEKEDWARAKGFYTKVSKNKESRLYIFALYKSAWCVYKLGDAGKAFDLMEGVLNESRTSKEILSSDGKKKIDKVRLGAEAISNLIPFYAESNRDYKKSIAYMDKFGSKKLSIYLLDKLAFHYIDNGDRKAARYLFKELIRKAPDSEKAFAYKHQIVSSYAFSKDNTGFSKALKEWIEDFSKTSSWYAANKKNKKLIADARRVQEAGMRNYVLQAHQSAKNSRQAEPQEFAREGYKVYLKNFPNSKYRDQMHYYYAELLFDMKRFKESSREYNWVLRNAPKSSYAESALINATVSLEKDLPSDKEIKQRIGRKIKPARLGAKARRFEKVAKRYLTMYPKGERRVPVHFKLGRVYYLHNQFDRAEKYFGVVVKEAPKSQLGEFAANLILDIYNLKKDYKGLEKAGKNLLRSGVSEKIVGDIQGVVEQSSFKSAQVLEAKGDFLKSAGIYRNFLRKNPGSPLLIKAYFNAGVNYLKAGKSLASLPYFSWITKNKNKEALELKKTSYENLVSIYLKTGQYAKAAQIYKILSQRKDGDREKYLYNYTILSEDLGNDSEALKGYLSYLQLYVNGRRLGTEKNNKKSSLLYSVAGIYERQKSWRKAIDYYKAFISSYGNLKEEYMAAHISLYEIYIHKLKDKKKATYWLLQTIKNQKKIRTTGKKEAAFAKFQLSLVDYNALIKLRWPQNPSEQKRVLDQKIRLLDKLTKEMGQVVKYGQGETIVSSFTVLARAYLHMYIFFKGAPVPKGLQKSEIRDYKNQLLGKALPFKKTGLKNYELAIENGERLEVLSPWFSLARNELKRFTNKKNRNYQIVKSQSVDWAGLL